MVWGRGCESSEAVRAGTAGAQLPEWADFINSWACLMILYIPGFVPCLMDNLLSLVIIPTPGSFVLPWLDAGCVNCNLAWTPTSGCPFFLDFPLSGPSITEDSASLD